MVVLSRSNARKKKREFRVSVATTLPLIYPEGCGRTAMNAGNRANASPWLYDWRSILPLAYDTWAAGIRVATFTQSAFPLLFPNRIADCRRQRFSKRLFASAGINIVVFYALRKIRSRHRELLTSTKRAYPGCKVGRVDELKKNRKRGHRWKKITQMFALIRASAGSASR